MASAPDTKVVTGEVRLSYVHLLEPYSSDPDKEKQYSVCLLIPKSDKATMRALRAAQEAAKKAKFGDKPPKNLKDTIHDGDEEVDTDESPEFAGHYFLNVSAKLAYPPAIVDRKLRPIMDATEIYSGCYARVSLVAFGYDVPQNKGVSFGLRNVQKLRDGEPLGGISKPEDDFDELDDEDDDDLI